MHVLQKFMNLMKKQKQNNKKNERDDMRGSEGLVQISLK